MIRGRLAHALLIACALGIVYADAVAGYAADPHYRGHFAILWALFGIAVVRAARGPLVLAATLHSRRDALAATAFGLATLLLAAGVVTGSSTLQRTALAGTLCAGALWAVRGWGTARCLGFAGFVLLCFGVPFSAYFALTKQLAYGLSCWLALPAGLLGYRVDGLAACFPHFRVQVTGDCSGFNQLVMFLALAALGVLVGAPRPRRALALVGLALGLAWVANGVRLWTLLALVALGWTRCITDDAWHAAVGLLVDLPFLGLMVWIVLRTHVAWPPAAAPAAGPSRRGLPLLVPALLQAALALWLVREPASPAGEPAWVARAVAPPGLQRSRRAGSEERERAIYGTSWLVNARFQCASDTRFDLFAFETRSRRHLNVHSLANCLETSGATLERGPALEVAGRRLFAFALRGPGVAKHGYYAFRVAGADRDDSWRTQTALLWQLLRGEVDSVALVRVLFDGPPADVIPAAERTILGWAAGLHAEPAAPR